VVFLVLLLEREVGAAGARQLLRFFFSKEGEKVERAPPTPTPTGDDDASCGVFFLRRGKRSL